jgi:electron-transferring-flavoprotein dehydrogenase
LRLRLSQLIDAHNATHPDSQLSKENIYVLEKAREIGQHCLSGSAARSALHARTASGIRERSSARCRGNKEAVYFLTEKSKFKLPITPPPLRDHGNYVISLNRFVKWLGGKVEETGITIFTGFAGSELLFDGDRVTGVRTDDKGVDKEGHQKSNFEPGYDLNAKVVILAEGPRGSLTKQLVSKFDLAKNANPQTYGIGVKGTLGSSLRAASRPAKSSTPWAGRSLRKNTAARGSTVAKTTSSRSASSPDSTIPTRASIRSACCRISRQHPMVAKLLEGGKMIRYGAKSMPYGGWWAIPPVAGNGWMILGDSAGFLNSARLKGIHLAIKSGMLAAETAFEALKKDDSSAAALGEYQKKSNPAGSKTSSGKCATCTRASSRAFYAGMFHTGLQMVTGGRGLRNRYPAKAGHEHMRKLAELPADGGAEAHLLGPPKATANSLSTSSPIFITRARSTKKTSPRIWSFTTPTCCNTRCVKEFGSPARISVPPTFTKWWTTPASRMASASA